MKVVFFIGLFFVVSGALGEHKSYQNHTVLRTQQLSLSQALALKKLEETGHYDFWNEARPKRNADIMAHYDSLDHLKTFLKDRHIHYSIMVDDVEKLIKQTETPDTLKNQIGAKKLDWDDYYSLDVINEFLEDTAAANSEFINVVSIGKSYEGREMKVIEIRKAGDGKPNVWLEAGIHAREWIAGSMATYLINELTKPGGAINIIDHLNIHVLPIANPDGYEYSRNSERLWRKTRSETGSSLGCMGVDGNRNWDFHWGESGASSNKCSDTYMGPEAFSEIEFRNIRDYVQTLEPTPILAHTLHSYSQLWLYPYGYAHNALPDNWQEIKELAEEAVDALYQVHQTVFDPINSADLYPAAGASDDWYKGVLEARFVYTTELRDTGHYGFRLPPEQIKPSGEELWAAFQVQFAKMMELSK